MRDLSFLELILHHHPCILTVPFAFAPFSAEQNFDWNELQKIPVAHGKSKHDVLDTETKAELDKIYKMAVKVAVTLTFVLLVLWPVLALPARVFTKVCAHVFVCASVCFYVTV